MDINSFPSFYQFEIFIKNMKIVFKKVKAVIVVLLVQTTSQVTLFQRRKVLAFQWRKGVRAYNFSANWTQRHIILVRDVREGLPIILVS